MIVHRISQGHIDLLVTTAAFGPSDVPPDEWPGVYFFGGHLPRLIQNLPELLDEAGRVLARENRKSLHACDPNAEIEGVLPYTFQTPHKPTTIEALKSIQCYRRQSSYHSGWHTSLAADFCDQLQTALICSLPGYDEAPWEVYCDNGTR